MCILNCDIANCYTLTLLCSWITWLQLSPSCSETLSVQSWCLMTFCLAMMLDTSQCRLDFISCHFSHFDDAVSRDDARHKSVLLFTQWLYLTGCAILLELQAPMHSVTIPNRLCNFTGATSLYPLSDYTQQVVLFYRSYKPLFTQWLYPIGCAFLLELQASIHSVTIPNRLCYFTGATSLYSLSDYTQ